MAFVALANLAELHDGYRKVLRVQGQGLLLIQENGQRFIIEDRCPHMDAPLATGIIADDSIICRAHGIRFSLLTGRAEGALAGTLDCLNRFKVAYDGNKIGIELPES